MISFGNDEIGETAICPHCKNKHTVEYGDQVLKDGTRVPSKMLAFVTCGDSTYIIGIGGKEIASR